MWKQIYSQTTWFSSSSMMITSSLDMGRSWYIVLLFFPLVEQVGLDVVTLGFGSMFVFEFNISFVSPVAKLAEKCFISDRDRCVCGLWWLCVFDFVFEKWLWWWLRWWWWWGKLGNGGFIIINPPSPNLLVAADEDVLPITDGELPTMVGVAPFDDVMLR